MSGPLYQSAYLLLSTQISKESLVINPIPDMGIVLQSELCAILTQRIRINIIHSIILYQDAIVTISIRVAYHGLYLSLCTMIYSFYYSLIRNQESVPMIPW